MPKRKGFLRKVVKMHSQKKWVAVATTLVLPQKKDRRKRRAESQLTVLGDRTVGHGCGMSPYQGKVALGLLSWAGNTYLI